MSNCSIWIFPQPAAISNGGVPCWKRQGSTFLSSLVGREKQLSPGPHTTQFLVSEQTHNHCGTTGKGEQEEHTQSFSAGFPTQGDTCLCRRSTFAMSWLEVHEGHEERPSVPLTSFLTQSTINPGVTSSQDGACNSPREWRSRRDPLHLGLGGVQLWWLPHPLPRQNSLRPCWAG